MPLFDFLKQDGGDFFQWLEDACNNTLQASLVLKELCDKFEAPQEAVARLHELEHKGDDIGHDIYAKLNNTFVTPMDREDIISLYSSIDDMTDLVHSAADMMVVYKVDSILPTARDLANCIVGCAEEVVKAVPHLRKRREMGVIQTSIIKIHSLENQADDLLRAGLAGLFSNPDNVVQIIKWRDIYNEMEEATDKAEDIADVLRGLVIKHA